MGGNRDVDAWPRVVRIGSRRCVRVASSMVATELEFQQTGGRCKLVTEDDFVSCVSSRVFCILRGVFNGVWVKIKPGDRRF